MYFDGVVGVNLVIDSINNRVSNVREMSETDLSPRLVLSRLILSSKIE